MTARLRRHLALAALAATPVALGCARESSRGPVQWTASNPSSPVGQTEAQAWSRSTSSDRPQPRPQALVTFPPAAEPDPACAPPAAGVTNLQPPTPRWPYSGATLQLGTTPP